MDRAGRNGSELPHGQAQPDPPHQDPVLAPIADFPRIDLRMGVESWDKRRQAGKRLRDAVPYAAQAGLPPEPTRPDPVALIEAAHRGRQPALIPLRVARMATSPFAVRGGGPPGRGAGGLPKPTPPPPDRGGGGGGGG